MDKFVGLGLKFLALFVVSFIAFSLALGAIVKNSNNARLASLLISLGIAIVWFHVESTRRPKAKL